MKVVEHFNGTARAISTGYIITDENTDINLASKIAVIVAKYGLNCCFGVDTFKKRYFYISGINKQLLDVAGKEIELL